MSQVEMSVVAFAECVLAMKECLRGNNYKKHNKLAKQLEAIWNELRSTGDVGREALAVLLRDRRPDVRAMAAVHLLKYKTLEARRVLEEVSEGDGLAAFGAAEALQRWDEGSWHLDAD